MPRWRITLWQWFLLPNEGAMPQSPAPWSGTSPSSLLFFSTFLLPCRVNNSQPRALPCPLWDITCLRLTATRPGRGFLPLYFHFCLSADLCFCVWGPRPPSQDRVFSPVMMGVWCRCVAHTRPCSERSLCSCARSRHRRLPWAGV